MRRFVSALATVPFVTGTTQAAPVAINATGSYSQDFNTGLPTSGSATWTNDSTIAAWYAQRTGNGTTIVADAGSNNAGNLYSYGTGTNADRAIGSLGSSNAAAGHFAWGVQFQNSGTGSASLGTLAFTGEQWRNSAAAAQTVTFWYKIGTAAITSLDPNVNTGWTALTSGDFTSPVTGGTAGALVGNNTGNKTAISFSSGLTLAAGEFIMFRWSDPDQTGADHGLAIDDFSLAWTYTGGGGGGGGGGSKFIFDGNGATAGAGTLSGSYSWSDTLWTDVEAGNTATAAFTDGQTPTFSAGTDGTGTFSVNVDTAVSANGIKVEQGDVTLASGTGTLTLAGATVDVAASSSLTLAEPVLGSSGLSKAGAGTLTMAANAAYTGTTTLSAGTLNIGNGGTTGSVPGALVVSAGTLVFNRSDDLAVSGAVSGNGAISKLGAGTLTLSGANSSYTGALAVNNGTLALTAVAAGGTGSLTVNSGATLHVSGINMVSATSPGLTLANGSTLRATGTSSGYTKSNFPSVAAGAAVTLNVPGATDVFSIGSAIRDGNAASQVTVTGSGTLAITSGSSGATAYAGSWVLNGPTLRLSDANALGNPGGAAPRPLTIQAGQVEIRNNTVANYNTPVTVAANTAFTPNNAGAGTTHNFGALSIGGYTLAISPGPQVTGGNATVTFGATTLTGNAVFSVGNSGAVGGSLTVASVGESGGPRSLTKAGTGTMTISGGSTFSGDVTVSGGGALSVASLTGLGTGGGTITVANGSTLEFTSATPGSTSRLLALGAQGGRVNVANAAATLTFTGGISGTDNTSDFTKAGAGTFNLTAAGTWAGNTFVNAGTLEVSGAGSVNSSGVMTVQGGSKLRVNTTGQVRMPSLDIAGSSSVDLLAGLLRTNSIDIQAGSTFTWTGGTLSVRDTVSDASGNPDLSDAGGAVVASGRSLAVDGDLSVGGLVDLEDLHIAGVVAFNHLDVNGNLVFQPGAQLASLGDAYLLRGGGGGPSVESGTLPLVTATSITGFNLSMFTAPTSDAGRPFSPSAFPVTTATRSSLLPNTWYLENTGSMLLFHYNVSAAIPEPDSAAMVFLGFALLRLAGRRRAVRAPAEPRLSAGRRRRF